MKLSLSLFERNKPTMGSVIRSRTVHPEDAKMLREVNGKMMRMYQSAITDNLTADMQSSITSANAEILTSLGPTRNRARTIERDDAYGSSIIRIYQNNVAGADPFPLQMRVGKQTGDTFVTETETNRKIEEWWRDFGNIENFSVTRNLSRNEYYLQMVSSIIRDGGYLTRDYPGFAGNKYGYAVEGIEMDRLDQYYNRPAQYGQNEIRFSIETDKYGGAVRYWILTRHPGEIYQSWAANKVYREPVPAENVIAMFDLRTRGGQIVGMSRLAPCIVEMHQLRQFDVAHLTAAIWSAAKPLFLTHDIPAAMGDAVPDFIRKSIANSMGMDEDGQPLGGQEGEPVEEVTPGSVRDLPYGTKPYLVDPKFPVESAKGFTEQKLKKIATGSGVPYFILAQDWGGINFSAGRLGLDDFHDTCEVLQNHLILGNVRPLFNRALKFALLSGKLDLPYSRLEEFQQAAMFSGRAWPYVQPVDDVQTDLMLIEGGIKSRDEIIRERGGRGVEEVNAQIASDRKSDAAHGLDFSTITKPTIKKGEPGPSPDGDSPTPAPNGNGKAKRSYRTDMGLVRSRVE